MEKFKMQTNKPTLSDNDQRRIRYGRTFDAEFERSVYEHFKEALKEVKSQ